MSWAATADESENLEWRRVVLAWQRATPVGTFEDEAMCTFDFVNITGGTVDTTWTTQDYEAVEAQFDLWMTTIRQFQAAGHTWASMKWYRMQFASPMTLERRLLPTGPPVRITPRALPGTSAAEALPYQVAMSVTERTAIPKHWGRFYIPGFAETLTGTVAGRWITSAMQTVLDATTVLYSNTQAVELFPVVVSTQRQTGGEGSPSALEGSLLGVTNIVIDDIPDVVRRRRPKQVLTRVSTGPLSTVQAQSS